MLPSMRTPAEAIAEILECIDPLQDREHVSLVQARGRVLAVDAHSDLDLPPFEKSAMDGFAVRSADFVEALGRLRLKLVGESRAGAPHNAPVGPGECVAIYTGSQLPADCDAVVMVERSRPDGAGHVLLVDRPQPGANVCHRGEDLRTGERVLAAGRVLRAEDLSVLAAVGLDPLPVLRRPRVHLATTGDELVRAHQRPGAGQIREGNTLYLGAALEACGVELIAHGIVRDEPRELERVFAQALDSGDALVTTGGVSMGKYDLVGAAFERLGVRPVLHKIAIKPGKPLWFGLAGKKPVFGLPGNPVSCLVGFEVFLRRSLAKLRGAEAAQWQSERLLLGRWCGVPLHPNPREQHHPVRLSVGADGMVELEPLRWRSSADIVGITRADALAVIPPDTTSMAGQLFRWRSLA